jgi:hypothetical protein
MLVVLTPAVLNSAGCANGNPGESGCWDADEEANLHR